MSLKKFTDKDVIQNTMRAYPKVQFFIFDGHIYYNDIPIQSGALSYHVYNVPGGHLSLYEYNIDRVLDHGIPDDPTTAKSIYPFITKQSAGASFRTAGAISYVNEFAYGDILTSSYPMSASITREYMETAGQTDRIMDTHTGLPVTDDYGTVQAGAPKYRHYYALKNRLNFYSPLSEHYQVSSSYSSPAWNKDDQNINLISIPSIFFGTRIDPGTVSLKWYFTGSLIGELKDTKQNGELIEVVGNNTGSIAGVVMYDEGFIMLTGSWDLSKPGAASMSIPIKSDGTSDVPRWLYFGAGALDGVNQSTAGANFVSASFDLSFRGQTDTQVMTMFTHARRGEVNYSNNPTFIKYGQDKIEISSSAIYQENSNKLLANVVSSSYKGYDADFKRQVYVSKVAIYDEHKNLIGLATLANPVLKAEDEDFTFKLKIDI